MTKYKRLLGLILWLASLALALLFNPMLNSFASGAYACLTFTAPWFVR